MDRQDLADARAAAKRFVERLAGGDVTDTNFLAAVLRDFSELEKDAALSAQELSDTAGEARKVFSPRAHREVVILGDSIEENAVQAVYILNEKGLC